MKSPNHPKINFFETLPEEEALKNITELDRGFMPYPWDTSHWESLDFSHHVIGAISLETIIGFALFDFVPENDFAHLLKVCLDSSYRGKNYGAELIEQSRQRFRKRGVDRIVLEVQETNERAVAFYKKQGFLLNHVSKSYYSNGDNALHMSLEI